MALKFGQRLAVLCLDLDRFKEVNDLFGHAAGDRALQAVAKRITQLLDDNQVMARLSGDEFAIIVPGLSNPAPPDASPSPSWNPCMRATYRIRSADRRQHRNRHLSRRCPRSACAALARRYRALPRQE